MTAMSQAHRRMHAGSIHHRPTIRLAHTHATCVRAVVCVVHAAVSQSLDVRRGQAAGLGSDKASLPTLDMRLCMDDAP
jgi:hypothetical protein